MAGEVGAGSFCPDINKPPVANILVIGVSGHGRTSLCNALTGQNHAAGAGLVSITHDISAYDPVARNGTSLVFIDTPGLGEGGSSEVSSEETLRLLDAHIKVNGPPDLAILVNKGYLSRSTLSDWRKLAKMFGDVTVPLMYVALGCEYMVNMMSWATDNEADIRKLGLHPKKIISGCLAACKRTELETHFRPKREETVRALWAAIDDCLDLGRPV